MKVFLAAIIYLLLGAGVSWVFYYWKKKDLLGGFIGGVIIALFGCILGHFIYVKVLKGLIEVLSNIANVNIIASSIGGYIAVYIYNRINHDKQRRDY